ncbi:Uncharacterized conserved protein, DUF1697 family [Desemzia incerta]|uniref:Uncharacterized conserved protein, DUF1697 family n=1 Tax=Desemzia incerta TaxID=82801 RepID=A0A1I5YNV4_9LACT|nr:DUF1697 domain-containing protein [Desemzia incerta]SFQ45873.1 Uncharacterized conserved protein, DUF1697 family [Desemzia incerta]
MKYIALFRGINVGGKNRVPMKELQKCFLDAGFTGVQTYINSGNVLFEAKKESDEKVLQEDCQNIIQTSFGFSVSVAIISIQILSQALRQVPKWWGKDPQEKHNALFTILPVTADEIMSEIGEVNSEVEKVYCFENIIFWSSSIRHYSKTKFSKIVGTKSYQKVTIRNANTTKKLCLLGTQ